MHQRFAALRLLDFSGAGQQRFQITIFIDQLRRSLDANARHARHIIRGIAGQRLHFHHLIRGDAEFFHHFRRAQRLLLHGIEHLHRRADQLHQILIGRNDRHMPARCLKSLGIGSDQIIRFKTFKFRTRHAKSIRRITDQAELRHQFRRRVRAVRLVIRIDLISKRIAPGVKHHRDMACGMTQQELGQHIRKAEYRIHRRAIWPRHGRQRVIGAKNIARTIHQNQVALTRLGFGKALGPRNCLAQGLAMRAFRDRARGVLNGHDPRRRLRPGHR